MGEAGEGSWREITVRPAGVREGRQVRDGRRLDVLLRRGASRSKSICVPDAGFSMFRIATLAVRLTPPSLRLHTHAVLGVQAFRPLPTTYCSVLLAVATSLPETSCTSASQNASLAVEWRQCAVQRRDPFPARM